MPRPGSLPNLVQIAKHPECTFKNKNPDYEALKETSKLKETPVPTSAVNVIGEEFTQCTRPQVYCSPLPTPISLISLCLIYMGKEGYSQPSIAAIKSIPDSSLEFFTKSYNLPNSQPGVVKASSTRSPLHPSCNLWYFQLFLSRLILSSFKGSSPTLSPQKPNYTHAHPEVHLECRQVTAKALPLCQSSSPAMEPTHLISPMPTVLAVGGHDDNLFKVGDFWKMELRKSICFLESKTPTHLPPRKRKAKFHTNRCWTHTRQPNSRSCVYKYLKTWHRPHTEVKVCSFIKGSSSSQRIKHWLSLKGRLPSLIQCLCLS